MGKAGDDRPATDIFKTLFGNLGKGGLPLFRNNPFRRKPEMQDATDLKSATERDGSLDQAKRTFKTENYESLERVRKKIKADGEPDVQDINNNGDEKKTKKEKKKKRTRGECIEEQGIFDHPEDNGVKSSHNIRSKEEKNGGLLKDRKEEEGMTDKLVQKKEKKKRTGGERSEKEGIIDHQDENGVKSSHSIRSKKEKNGSLLKDRNGEQDLAEELVQKDEKKKKKKTGGKCIEEQENFHYPEGNGVKSNRNILTKEEKNGALLKDRNEKEGVAEDLIQMKKEKKKKTRGECIEERGIFYYREGNEVASSHDISAKGKKNLGLLNDRKGEESVAKELVQTKKAKKKRLSLKENQQSAQEADVDEIQQILAANHGKRTFEEEDDNKSNKKVKFSDLKSYPCVDRNGEVEIGKGLVMGNREQADASKKSALGKRKWDSIEEDYEVRHGILVNDTLAQEGGAGKIKLGKRKRGDDVADMVIKESSFDDEKKLQRTVFVGNLPLRIKKKLLIREFSQFGKVESVRLRSVPILDSKLPRKSAILQGQINDSFNSVHAYIVFKDEESARAALSYNMVEVGGNHIRVDRARPPCKKLKGENNSIYDDKRTVFVGNLPFDVKDEELYQMFNGIKPFATNVEAVRVIRDPQTNIGKGIAYVLFTTRDVAMLAVKKNQFKIRDRNLRLYKVQPFAAPKLQSNKPSGRGGLCGKRSAESRPMSNGLSKKKAKSPLSYQGTRASKTGGHLLKGTSLTSINKEGNSFSKSHILRVNDPKRLKFKRTALGAQRRGPPQSSAQNYAGKKRKLDIEARMASSKPSKKAKVY